MLVKTQIEHSRSVMTTINPLIKTEGKGESNANRTWKRRITKLENIGGTLIY